MSTDQIDLIVSQWRAHGGIQVNPAPLEVTGRILQIAQHIERARLKALAPWGLTLADFDVLATLTRSAPERGVNPRDLLHETMITSGAMTTRLDRLEALDCIRRDPDASDRRGVLVVLTDTGRAIAERAFMAVMETEEALLVSLGNVERRRLQTALRALGTACREASFA